MSTLKRKGRTLERKPTTSLVIGDNEARSVVRIAQALDVNTGDKHEVELQLMTDGQVRWRHIK